MVTAVELQIIAAAHDVEAGSIGSHVTALRDDYPDFSGLGGLMVRAAGPDARLILLGAIKVVQVIIPVNPKNSFFIRHVARRRRQAAAGRILLLSVHCQRYVG